MSFLEESIVEFNAEATDAEDAIRRAGRLLVTEGYAREEYVEAMVKSYRENGAYFVIAPGVAIPHARPESGTLRSAVSLVTLEKGVDFGHSANDPVRLVFGLAASSGEEHLKVIQKIAKFLGKKENTKKIQQAQSYQEIQQLKEEIE